MHLIDTSVWIDFLRGNTNQRVHLLEALLEEGEAYLCEITFAEICFGARDSQQLKKYFDYFQALPFLSLPTNWHLEAARMGHHLRIKGQRPFLADLMIALTAFTHKAVLLTQDQDFQIYRSEFGLTVE